MANKASQKEQITLNLSLNPDTTPILYTDEVHMSTNEFGLTLDIIQKMSMGEGRVVARIGMSREHARNLTEELGRLLILTEKGKTNQKN
jgi:hypothetical protein